VALFFVIPNVVLNLFQDSFGISILVLEIRGFKPPPWWVGVLYLKSVHKLTVSKKVVIPAKAGIQGSR